MVHHPGDIFLSQIVKAGSFRKYAADEFMVDLDRALLVGTAGIAEKILISEKSNAAEAACLNVENYNRVYLKSQY